MAQSRWKIPLIAAAIVVGLGGVVAGASELLNPPPGGPVPGHDATLSSTSQTYMEAAKSNDCGIVPAPETDNIRGGKTIYFDGRHPLPFHRRLHPSRGT